MNAARTNTFQNQLTVHLYTHARFGLCSKAANVFSNRSKRLAPKAASDSDAKHIQYDH